MNADGREWNLNYLLFADDIALVTDLVKWLRQLVGELGMVFKMRNLKVQVMYW